MCWLFCSVGGVYYIEKGQGMEMIRRTSFGLVTNLEVVSRFHQSVWHSLIDRVRPKLFFESGVFGWKSSIGRATIAHVSTS